MALTTNHKIAAGAVGAAVLVVAAFFAGRHQSAPSMPEGPVAAMNEPQNNIVDRNGANSNDESRAARRSADDALNRNNEPRRVAQQQPARDSGSTGYAENNGQGGTAQADSRLCAACATVLSVRTEAREGQGTGIGVVGGAVVGGLLGSAIGGGTGKKIATVGGAVAGGYAGNEIEKRQRSTTVWVVKMRNADQSVRTMHFSHDPGVQNGDIVRVSDGNLIRQ
ncbi:glycine zipper 2TM domain-containing protein [Mitsuaria sp. GD03876]|uniref:glycine zipper 2TM domain-containing protein n=1 Tax=Mitsuaria sp. GD03876 TaxID=2975399 RepID=UPI0024497FBA|nr:glycine zipper 2TM domain-containing protein [Mitsuaria sp. GD03876]